MRAEPAAGPMVGKAVANSDVVVFQRPDDDSRYEALKLLKEAGKLVVFDNDDTYIPNSGVPTSMKTMAGEKKLIEMNENLIRFVREADLVTCTTEFLANEYRQHNPNVVVLPNYVDPKDWPTPKRNIGVKTRIGFVGSVASNQEYEHLTPLLKKLAMRDDIQLVLFALPADVPELQKSREVFGEELSYWNQFDIDWQPFVPMADYQETLNDLRLDIMLIPRQDSYFNRCKSNLKFLEAAMCEVPVVAQSFPDKQSPYDLTIEDGVTGLLANTPEEWETKTLSLIADKIQQRVMGFRAKQHVLTHFTINDHYKKWKEAYAKALNRKRGIESIT